ncbi:MAG: glycosyltransferase family 2 protein [Ignavibacteriales bacterium]|nr:glycosyltransferase family 2 protein [Ignavibacteriales bacterium]
MDRRLRSTAVVIPAFNASKTITDLLSRLLRFVGHDQIILVDDGSEDETAELSSRERVRVLRHHRNLGKGKALQTAFDEFLHSDFPFVATMDADLQHAPEHLPSFAEQQALTDADLVIGWRKVFGTGMPAHRMLSNLITSKLVSLRTGITIKDSQCGYRYIARDVIETVSLQSSGYEAETEFLLKAARKGFRIESVPIETIYTNEKSKIKNWETTVKFVKVLLQEY